MSGNPRVGKQVRTLHDMPGSLLVEGTFFIALLFNKISINQMVGHMLI